MNAKQIFFRLLIVAGALLIPRAKAAPIKVLIVEGLSNHDWKHRVEIARAILARDGSFDVDVTVTPSSANDPGWASWRPDFKKYDVVISGYTDLNGALRWPAEVENSFVNFVNSGGGFYAWHEANSAFSGWSEYGKMLGIGWRGDKNGSAIIVNADESLQIVPPGSGGVTAHGNRVDVEVKRLNSHPINAGLPVSWKAADIEIYRYARGPAQNMTVLSYALDAGTQLRFPIDWVVNYGQGRCYASSYGHVWSDQAEPPGTECAAFQTIFVRALKWLAKQDPGTATPSDFPSPSTVSLRPYEQGVSGLDSVHAIGAFANGKLPTQSTPPSSVKVQQAFPNLSWESPIQAMPWAGSTTDLAIAEMDGRIYRVLDNDTTATRTLVLDIQDRVQYQNWTSGSNSTKTGGIFSLAFHPQFGKGLGKDYLYVYYINNPNDSASANPPYYDRLARFTWNPATSTFNAASELIMTNQYDTVKGHDGGGMAFGADGFLYICFGDEGTQDAQSTPHAQRINDRIRSGVWRLDVDQQGGSVSHPIRRQPVNAAVGNGSYTQGYYIPNSNPWQDPSGGTLEEFYALGLRNPLRMSFDSVTGAFWIGDVGGSQREEVDILDAPALNYQWNYQEGGAPGFRPPPSPLVGTDRPPVYDYPHTVGNCVVGGHVYRGTAHPWLQGKYLFGDNGSQRIYALDYNSTTRKANSVVEIAQGRTGTLWTGISAFGVDSQGETLVLQMGGGVSGAGRISRLKPQSNAPDDSHFPATLSATGLFTNLANLTPEPGMIPYEVNMPLWSAGTDKKRWVIVPNDGVANSAGEQITYSENDSWALPVGSVFVKQFNHPDDGRKLETRVLIHGTDGGWGGITYKWRADGSDADALEGGASEPLTIGGQTFDYLYPARNQCSLCHTPLAGSVLGFRTRQLNRRITYPDTGRRANQIETLSKIGLIPTFISEVDLRAVITSASREDPAVSDEHFVRSYLDANCSHCHQPGGTTANFDARLTTPLANQNLLCGPVNDGLGIDVPVVMKPGRIADSVAFHRINTMSPSLSMPPVAKGRVDDLAVAKVANWILGLEVDCCTSPPIPIENTIVVGNGTVPGASPATDTWRSSMVINETDTYTNTTGAPLSITFDRFRFHATGVTDPITPFVVRVNGDNNFTVRAIGTSRAAYVAGANDFAFSTSTQQLTLAVGEKIAMGFLDALPDGTGGTGVGAITYNSISGDEVHYSGGTADNNSGRVTVGVAPVFGTTVLTNLRRNYYYSISFALGSLSDRDDDHDGLPDSWELAYATSLASLSPAGDHDGDGVSDGDERLAGTDPFDSASRFQIREMHPEASVPGVVASFDSVPGRTYAIWVSPDLTNWKDMGTLRSASWPATTTTFEMASGDLPNGFFQHLFMKVTTIPASP